MLAVAWLFAGCFTDADKGDSSGDSSGDTAAGDTAETEGCTGVDGDDDGYCGNDCDDADAAAHPGAAERCNEADDDCDGEIDEGVGGTYYIDADGDGFGAAEPVVSCDAPTNAVDNGADCDDTNDEVHPDQSDDANGVDDDCDGQIDEDAATTPVVTVTWSADLVDISISGTGSGWDFGMAETGVGKDGWFGESCIPGDEPYGYPDYGYDVCHALGRTGGRLDTVHSVDDVEDGTTLFTYVIANSGSLTYFFENQDNGSCFVFGEEVAYYAALGCSEL